MPPKRDRSTTVILKRLEGISDRLSGDFTEAYRERQALSKGIHSHLVNMGTANSVGHTDTRQLISELTNKVDEILVHFQKPWYKRIFSSIKGNAAS